MEKVQPCDQEYGNRHFYSDQRELIVLDLRPEREKLFGSRWQQKGDAATQRNNGDVVGAPRGIAEEGPERGREFMKQNAPLENVTINHATVSDWSCERWV